MEETSSRFAELCACGKEPVWFCIRTHLKHEHIAAAHLRQIPGVEVFNPQLRLLRSTRRGRRCSTESLFPNYLFARCVLESTLEKVTYTPAVKVVLRFGDRVPVIPDAVIEDLRQGVAELSSARKEGNNHLPCDEPELARWKDRPELKRVCVEAAAAAADEHGDDDAVPVDL